ncbi:hypothetical protein L218DRAFT_945258 [Marasmius fiardii PR-910]|nr:hypothetical protein L218DRAFT_945258 [Marasmius fiardii PR-910]
MSAEQLLTKINFSQYEWKEIPAKDGAVGRGRPCSGGEVSQDQWNRLFKGDQTLFFGTYVELSTPVTQSQLVQASRDAWISLRYNIPTVAASIYHEENRPFIAYYTATSAEIDKWANRTLTVTTQDTLDLDALRRELGQEKVPSSTGDHTWMHLAVESGSSTGPNAKAGFLFHTHHGPFDGTALKVITNAYLKGLVKAVSGEDVKASLQWGKEFDNLPPSAFTVLDPSEPLPIAPGSSEEPSFQHPFYGSLGMVLQTIGEAGKKPYGFRPRDADPGWPFCRREEIVFTEEESKKVLESLKRVTSEGNKFSVTHLTHAALAMATIFDHPPKKEDAHLLLNCFSLANCRNRLREPYSSRDGYAGYALGITQSSVPVALFVTQEGERPPLDKDLLAKVLKDVRKSYEAEKNIPSRLAIMAPACDIFAAVVSGAVAAGMFPPNQCFSFSSDGIGEKHLDATFANSAGKNIVSITKFWTALNRTDPGPFFRVSSWKGIIDISADFNANLVSVEEVKGHVAKWKEFILLVSDLPNTI